MKKPKSLEQRIERIPEAGCWIWTGAVNDDGYGRVYGKWTGRRRMTAHRWVYESTFGKIPVGMSVLHRCDVASCVNPDHLYLGTQIQNVADRHKRGRNGAAKISGELSVCRKVTESVVREIRSSNESGVILAARFGLGMTQISRIRRREAWKSVGD